MAVEGTCYTHAWADYRGELYNPGQRTERDRFDKEYQYFLKRLKPAKLSPKAYAKKVAEFESLVIEGARLDGMAFLGKDIEVLNGGMPRGFYLAALFLQTYNSEGERSIDYHWRRQDSDGKWSQKEGRYGWITRHDTTGAQITDPRAVQGSTYNIFSGFTLVPTQG